MPLERLCMELPIIHFVLHMSELSLKQLVVLFVRCYLAMDVDSILCDFLELCLQVENCLVLLDVLVVLRRLLLELHELLLDLEHVLFVRRDEVRLVLLNDCCVDRV